MGRILFHTVNGHGLGHQSRCVAIAAAIRAVDPSQQQLFLTESADTRLISGAGFAAFQVPPPPTNFYPDRRWSHLPNGVANQIREDIARAVVERFAPDLLCSDTYFWPELQTIATHLNVRQVGIIRNGAFTESFFQNSPPVLRQLSAIVFPHDETAALAELGRAAGLPTIFSGSILRRTRGDLDLAEIQSRYRFDPAIPTIVASNAGGHPLVPEDFPGTLLAAAQLLRARGHRFRLLLVSGPLQSQFAGAHLPVASELGDTVIEYEERLLELFAAATIVVCRAGYNTIAEIEHLGVPAVAIPAWRSPTEVEQAAAAERAGTVLTAPLDPTAIADRLDHLLAQPRWRFDPDQPDEALERKLALARWLLEFSGLNRAGATLLS